MALKVVVGKNKEGETVITKKISMFTVFFPFSAVGDLDFGRTE